MDRRPEGAQRRIGGSRPRWLVLLVLAFAAYLAVRLVQGGVWFVQWLF